MISLSSGISLLLGFLAKFLLGYIQQKRDDANKIELGKTATTAAVNKETSDANRRALDAAHKVPDVNGVIDDMERGKF